MIEEKIQKKIHSKIEMMEEVIQNQLQIQAELLSGLDTIQYLMFLQEQLKEEAAQ